MSGLSLSVTIIYDLVQQQKNCALCEFPVHVTFSDVGVFFASAASVVRSFRPRHLIVEY